MAAYMLFYARISDQARFGAYASAVRPLIAGHGGRALARGVPSTLLEGDWPWHVAAVFEFPSVEAGNAFWNSAEYAEIKKLRDGAAEFQGVLMAGL